LPCLCRKYTRQISLPYQYMTCTFCRVLKHGKVFAVFNSAFAVFL
jgi:hypothetical protein